MLPRFVSDFAEGGASDELTLSANREAFQRIGLVPRALVDVSARSTATSVLGQAIDLPVLLAPTGLQRLVRRNADLESARAAGRAGTIAVVSSGSAFDVRRIASESGGPLWFQLYLWGDRSVTKKVVMRAAEAGCSALVVTVDVPTVGLRERDTRNGMTLPPRMSARNLFEGAKHPRWASHLVLGPKVTFKNFEGLVPSPGGMTLMRYANEHLISPSSTWDDLAWLRTLWPGKLVVKGLMDARDAVLAAQLGVDAVVVSNHGGRQLDGAPASLDVLSSVAGALPAGVEAYLDGGVRRGSDIAKALALGARAVLIGRPYWYGLAVAGESGVIDVLKILKRELDNALALTGTTSVHELTPDVLWKAPRENQ